MAEDMSKRDNLAAERTHYANERTLLSYLRTSLGLLGGGVALAHFVPTISGVLGAIVLFIAAAGFGAFGTWRFRRNNHRIKHGHAARG